MLFVTFSPSDLCDAVWLMLAMPLMGMLLDMGFVVGIFLVMAMTSDYLLLDKDDESIELGKLRTSESEEEAFSSGAV